MTEQKEIDPKKTMAEVSNLVSSHCICGHSVREHYPLTNWMTGCKDDKCDCLEYEGA